ncbi:helix-turn-helix transcriptional regulator [Entomohabitans teleogrylli]|uniref:helix-turn-helix transcriptional regulator n=1 Tax=Entomohabitans teleogrylli TaxID=1384589 RepID=UPI00073D2411|nr:LuxR C-terminal-related transcriptional regulator [Entomohabitans teleogrylli]
MDVKRNEPFICSDIFLMQGLKALLPKDLVAGEFYFTDKDYLQQNIDFCRQEITEKTVVFVEDDFEYHYVNCLLAHQKIIFLPKRISSKDLYTWLLVQDDRIKYNPRHRLTGRERQILLCVIGGIESAKIMRSLGINEKTFYTHRAALVKKMNLKNRHLLYKNITGETWY